MDNHLYNLERLKFKEVKAENIFDIEALVESIQNFLLINSIAIEDCLTMFTEKLFSYISS